VIRGLAAALVILLVFTAGTAVAARDVATPAAEAHVCSAADRKFIETARVNLPAFATWRDDYLASAIDHGTFGSVARETAVLVVERTAPQDHSLQQARLLIGAMLAEFQRAAAVRETGGLAAHELLHAQQLGGTLRGHFAGVAPGLGAVGCDISSLFLI
jgi:hypothetical protein